MEGGGFAWTLPQVLPARTSLTRKPRSKYWFACFRDVNGKQRRRSTGQTDRKKALKVAEQFEQIGRRKLAPRTVRESLAAFYREIYGETLPVATVRKFVADWGFRSFAVQNAACDSLSACWENARRSGALARWRWWRIRSGNERWNTITISGAICAPTMRGWWCASIPLPSTIALAKSWRGLSKTVW